MCRSMGVIAFWYSTMTLTTVSPPTIHLAADLGSSASKFFYRVHSGQSVPLWMGAEVVDGLSELSVPGLNSGGRPQDSAWIQLDSEIILVGDSARAVLETTSLTAKKSATAAYKLVAALGAIAELENLPSHYDASIWMVLPLTEIRTRQEIAEQLDAICSSGFGFRGKQQQVRLAMKFFPEGFGLYLRRKQQLERSGQSISQRRTMIVMMGHRNLSTLYFERGTLQVAGSNSAGPGFWPVFEKSARALGVTTPDYGALVRAIMTDQPQQISPSRGSLFDFGEMAATVRCSYWQAVSIYLRDHVLKRFGQQSLDIVISGGR